MPIIVQDVPIRGLDVSATISGPVIAGSVLTFSSTIDDGTGVSYVWTVDGVIIGPGPTLSYTFADGRRAHRGGYCHEQQRQPVLHRANYRDLR